jgi:hypothetical protein
VHSSHRCSTIGIQSCPSEMINMSELPSNRSFDADTHRQCAARRVDEPTPCAALPVRAGQLRR